LSTATTSGRAVGTALGRALGRAVRHARQGLFAPAPARGLALARIVFYGGLFVLYAGHDFRLWGEVGPVFWRPLWPLPTDVPPPPATLVAAVSLAFKASLLSTCLGIATRWSAALAALAGLFTLGLPNQWGVTFHTDAPIVLLLLVLAFARLGDDLAFPPRRRPRAAPAADGEYRWPLVAARLTLCLVFLAAGLSKCLAGGWDWIASDHLARLLLKQQVTSRPWLDWGVMVAAQPLLYHGLAALTVAIELAYPLALVWRRARPLLVTGGVLLLLGFAALVGPRFAALAFAHVWWLPWERLTAGGTRGR